MDKCGLINSEVLNGRDEKAGLSEKGRRGQQTTTAHFNRQFSLWPCVSIAVRYSVCHLRR